jgi:4'-phosphopantetheinyl transferase
MAVDKGKAPALRLTVTVRPVINFRGIGAGLPLDQMRHEFENGSVQVVFLAMPGLPVDPMLRSLSQDEHVRLGRISNPIVAQRFIAGRWLLRSVLAAVIGGLPEGIHLQYGEHGKPALAEPFPGGVAFNLSHSGDLAALALARDGRVGIDIERLRPLSDAPRLARRILTVGEMVAYDALPADARLPTLIAAWARKEAVLKALGTGISGSPSSVEVSLDPGLEGQDFVALASGAIPDRWSVLALAMPSGFQGALALEKAGHPVVVWQAFPVTPDR